MKSQIMYMELKGPSERWSDRPGRIGRVSFSKSGKSLRYGGKTFERCKHDLGNYKEVESGDIYWISGCKKAGDDRLHAGVVEIDDDVREEYWTEIRKKPECINEKSIHGVGKYGGKRPSRM